MSCHYGGGDKRHEKVAERLGDVHSGRTGEGIGRDRGREGGDGQEGGGGKMEKRGGKGRKRDKPEQVLIGERPGSECQRYLLSQRGLRCEARLSRGP